MTKVMVAEEAVVRAVELVTPALVKLPVVVEEEEGAVGEVADLTIIQAPTIPISG